MEMEATPSSSIQGRLWVDVFGVLSYYSHVIPQKPEYQRNKAKSKMAIRNPAAVIDSLGNVIEPELNKQPKNLREVACNKMINQRIEPQSIEINLWKSDAPQFVVPMVPHYPELAVVCANRLRAPFWK